MKKYSVFAIAREAMRGHKGWEEQWSSPEPKKEYDVIIVGAGGHGLATAYYLATVHGITNVAVLEKGWLGGGNTGRNTTIIRSNYLYDESAGIYDHALKLWDGLSQELNYNVMYSPRGVMMLAHNVHDIQVLKRHVHANRLNGIDNEWLTPEAAKEFCPPLNISRDARYPVMGATLQRRGGTARHDAVAWGYARGADRRGVDIIENCEVTGFLRDGDRISGVSTSRGEIRAKKVAVAVAGSTGQVMRLAGIDTMPIESHVLQAFVTESLKPFINTVLTFGMGHFYMSQSDKGGLVYGGDLDGYNSYAQRGSLPVVDEVMSEMLALFPGLARVRMLRSWGGVCDMSMDGSPIITTGPLPGMYLNCGWCYGGFKATPASGWCFAWTIAKDEPHDFNAPFTLDRFHRGLVIDDKGQGATPRLH
ncbi:MAG: sarcosine oxidase subunit beta [Mesorhizobium sp.]|nr:MAG: sarcosine oxidase subunit beta [Mesorhizobium sp.]